MCLACKGPEPIHSEWWPAISQVMGYISLWAVILRRRLAGFGRERPKTRAKKVRPYQVLGGWAVCCLLLNLLGVALVAPGTAQAGNDYLPRLDELLPQPGRVQIARSVEPFLIRPFYEWDLQGPGEVAGWGKRKNSGGLLPASDNLNYNSAADYGVNTYFDHKYPFSFDYPASNAPDNEAPDVFVTYRGTQTPESWSAERGYSGHNAIDFNLAAGRAVLAAAGGKVITAEWGSCGKSLMISHSNGYKSWYLHLDEEIFVKIGDEVRQGQPIAKVGNFQCTGPHLHFGLQNEQNLYVDPYGYCPGQLASDPWEQRSGARSYWLWKNIPSPCRQQNNAVSGPITGTKAVYPLAGSSLLPPPDLTPRPTVKPVVTVGPGLPRPMLDVAPAPRLANSGQTSPEARQQLISLNLNLLNNEDELLRQGAVNLLAKLQATEAIGPLLDRLADNDGAVRESAIRGLITLGAQTQAIATYQKMLQDTPGENRSRAAQGLAILEARTAIPNLIAKLADSDAAVRYWSIEALNKLNATEARPRLTELLTDNDPSVRQSAADVLKKWSVVSGQ